MYDTYSAKRLASQCMICTVPKERVPTYDMYTAKGGDS